MLQGTNRISLVTATAVLLVLTVPAMGGLIDFNSVPAGTVVAGAAPGGGFVPGNTFFPEFTLTATNNGGGPNSLLIFDSTAPTGGDWDLGSPNTLCSGGGPGTGAGGQPGMPGENCSDLGNLMIVAANVNDTSPANGLVDQPNDEPNGGIMDFDFTTPVHILSAAFLDLDDGEYANITFYYQNNLAGTKYVPGIGDNSYQEIDLSLYEVIDRMEIEFASSGALASLNYSRTTATESTSWGNVKKQFR